MKVAIHICILSITACYALEDGKYVPDDSGVYVPDEEGRYTPDNSGQYIPDYSGFYQHDESGRYLDDDSGKYRDSIDKYRHQHRTSQNKVLSAGSTITNKFIKPNQYVRNNLVSSSNAINYGKLDDSRWKIIRQISDVDIDGYRWEYETENEISAEESGKILNPNTGDETLKAKGFFKYTGPDNVVYSISYTADENGFIPDGDHLPVGLQRALAQIVSKKF